MKNKLYLLIILLILFQITFSQISKYQEFALFVAGKEFPKSIKDETINKNFWIKYCENLASDWAEIDSTRLIAMQEWQETEISTKINDTLNLFYPFSGPDFLHAYLLFPNANNYLMLAQEHLGNIPDISKMKQKELEDYLNKFYFSIRDIFQRSYFITMRMTSDLYNDKIQGCLPVMLFFLVQTNHSIIDVKYEKLNSMLTFDEFVTNPSGKFSSGESINIIFYNNVDTTKLKNLRYFRCDISDDGLKNAATFKKYLSEQKNINTYTKSASYLMHNSYFSEIRKIVLDNSNTVLQDDTGVPYKYFCNDNWSQFLYGTYVKPIKDFGEYLKQDDLMKAYESKINVYELPFSLGYHWRDGQQNQLLFIKIK